MLNHDRRRFLLEAARSAVSAKLSNEPPSTPVMTEEDLRDRRGAFVSVHAGDELRGCIGIIEGGPPLMQTVVSCAISAATQDPRFASVTLQELPRVRFEISVLFPSRAIADVAGLEIGRDGVIVSNERARALILPQVAVHQGWNVEEFLSAACQKAGLPPAAWREEGVSVETFTAEVFAEEA